MKKDRPIKVFHSIGIWLSSLVLINFIIFVIITIFIGGDAINGKVENGHYYLHGYSIETGLRDYTEVSKSIFDYSKWHIYSIWITFPLIFVYYFIDKRMKTKINKSQKIIDKG